MPDSVDFLRARLEAHRLQFDAVQPQNLVVPDGQTYALAPEDPHMPGVTWVANGGRNVQIQSLADLKALVGIPSPVAQRLQPVRVRPAGAIIRRGTLEVGPRIVTRATASVFAVAKAYLVEDAALHAVNEADLWGIVAQNPYIWVALSQDVTIGHDAQLLLGPTVHKYVAANIYIKTGGQLRAQSNFTKIECLSITGNLP